MGKYPLLVDIPAEDYHRAAREGRYLSSHLLGDFRKSPRLYHKKMAGEIEPADSAALTLGRAVHTLVLECKGLVLHTSIAFKIASHIILALFWIVIPI